MGALGAFKRIAEFCVKMAGARIFAAGIQPQARRAEGEKSVICQGFDKSRPPSAAGLGQRKAAQFNAACGVADFTKQRETCGLAVCPRQNS